MKDAYAALVTDPVPQIEAGGCVIVFASTTTCVPCAWMKPVVRKFAVSAGSRATVVEVNCDNISDFRKRHNLQHFPQLLHFRDGTLTSAQTGFHGLSETLDWLERAVDAGAATLKPQTELDENFAQDLERAQKALDDAMQVSNDALVPHIEATEPDIAAVKLQIANLQAASALTQAEANALFLTEVHRIYAPFQDKIDAHRRAQALGLVAYAEIAEAGVQNYATAHRAAGSRVVCSPDGSFCERVTNTDILRL